MFHLQCSFFMRVVVVQHVRSFIHSNPNNNTASMYPQPNRLKRDLCITEITMYGRRHDNKRTRKTPSTPPTDVNEKLRMEIERIQQQHDAVKANIEKMGKQNAELLDKHHTDFKGFVNKIKQTSSLFHYFKEWWANSKK